MTRTESDPRDAFFFDRTKRMIVGKSEDDALNILTEALLRAMADKAAGYGPPQHEITKVYRIWHPLCERWVGQRFPSERKAA